jgi:hypothetical protein
VRQPSFSIILRTLSEKAVSKDARTEGRISTAPPLCVLRDDPSGLLRMLRTAFRKDLLRREGEKLAVVHRC